MAKKAEIQITRPGFLGNKCLVKISIDLSAGIGNEKLDEFVSWVASHAHQISRYCVGEVHYNDVAQNAIDKVLKEKIESEKFELL